MILLPPNFGSGGGGSGNKTVSFASAPLVTDDSSVPYAVGDHWIDTSVAPVQTYVATDVSVGAAVWLVVTSFDELNTHIADSANPHSTDVGNLGSGTLAELNTVITDATLDDSGDSRTPTAHAASHQNGGGDEINVAGLSGELADPQPASLSTLIDLDSVGDLVFGRSGPPVVTDDSTKQWVVGDHQQDTVTGIIYAAEDVSVGAAVWEPITATASILESGGSRFPIGSFPTIPAFMKVNISGVVVGQSTILTADLGNDQVTNPKLADMPANTMKGNNTGGAINPKDLTTTETRALLNVEDGANNYVHPNHSGDVTSVADGAQTIANNAVTNAKAANMAADTIKGNDGVLGDPKDLTIAETDALLGVGEVLTWVLNGALDTGTFQDGSRGVSRPGVIKEIIMTARQRGGAGSGGNSIVDINKHIPTKPITTQRNGVAGTTIYTTQGNRPTITGNATNTDNAIIQAVAPDVTTFVAGDFFSLDVDDDGDTGGNSPMDIVVEMKVEYTG